MAKKDHIGLKMGQLRGGECFRESLDHCPSTQTVNRVFSRLAFGQIDGPWGHHVPYGPPRHPPQTSKNSVAPMTAINESNTQDVPETLKFKSHPEKTT